MDRDIEELTRDIERLKERRDALYRAYVWQGGGELYDRVRALDGSIGDMEYRLVLLYRRASDRCGYRRRTERGGDARP